MNLRTGTFVALALNLLLSAAWAQKPPTPAPPTPTSPPSKAPPASSNSQPLQTEMDRVIFLLGRVSTNDGSSVPNNVLIERICNNRVRQQVYASSKGDFSMQLGSMADSFLDASGERSSQPDFLTQRNSPGPNKSIESGIPRRELANCELQASAFGFRSRAINLIEITPFNSTVDVGAIVVQRAIKVQGTTVSAALYKVPKDARNAYEKGLQAEKNGKLPDARQYFQRAVELYPKFTNAWFQLGAVFQKQNQNDSARTAYAKATAIDTRFLPAYLSLTALAYDEKNWTEVLALTRHIFDLDPMTNARVTGYVLDLDPVSSADAYFYNAMANYRLNRLEDAEKSALKVERLDLQPRFPQVRLLLADLFARKNNYPAAISQLQTYLESVPHDKDADQIRARLANFEKLSASSPSTEAPNP